jgi:hypothetical protein
VLTPTPASAVACIQPPLPNPINTNTVGDNQPIICVNTEPRTNPAGNAINLTTDGTGSYIDLSNSGVLSVFRQRDTNHRICAFRRAIPLVPRGTARRETWCWKPPPFTRHARTCSGHPIWRRGDFRARVCWKSRLDCRDEPGNDEEGARSTHV